MKPNSSLDDMSGDSHIDYGWIWRCLSYYRLGTIFERYYRHAGNGFGCASTGIISSGFMNEISSTNADNKSEKDDILYCPYCGKPIRDDLKNK
jgi:hypothetical protein